MCRDCWLFEERRRCSKQRWHFDSLTVSFTSFRRVIRSCVKSNQQESDTIQSNISWRFILRNGKRSAYIKSSSITFLSITRSTQTDSLLSKCYSCLDTSSSPLSTVTSTWLYRNEYVWLKIFSNFRSREWSSIFQYWNSVYHVN